jgi:hypothetical protein
MQPCNQPYYFMVMLVQTNNLFCVACFSPQATSGSDSELPKLKTTPLSPPPHTQAPSTSSANIGQLHPSMTAESAHPQAPPIAPPTQSYSASSAPQLAANLMLSQGHHQQHQANALPHQSMATVYPMLQKSAALPNQTTLPPDGSDGSSGTPPPL